MQSDIRLKLSALLLDLFALSVAIGFVIGGLIVRARLPITPLVIPGTHNPGVADAIFYEELGRAYRTSKEKPHNFDTLGFDTDHILYRSGFFSTIMERENWSDRELASACYSAYFRAWHQAPYSMLNKV